MEQISMKNTMRNQCLLNRLFEALLLSIIFILSPGFGNISLSQEPAEPLVEPGKPLQFDYVFDLNTRTAQGAIHGKDGFIWIGGAAGSGLFRWDGYALKGYEPGPGSLSSGTIHTIIEDSEDPDILWLATTGGLNRFHKRNGSATHYMHHPENPDSLLSNTIYHMAQDAFDTDIIWLGTTQGLSKFSKKNGIIANYKHDPNTPDSKKRIAPKTAWRVLPDQNDPDILWLGFWGSGMDKFDKRKEEFTHFRHDPNNPDSFGCPNNVAHSMAQDRENPDIIWVGTLTCGLQKFSKASGTFKLYSHKTHAPLPAKIGLIHDDGHGVLWMGGWSKEDGLTLFDKRTETFANYKHVKTDPRSLADDAVVNVFQDRDKRMWVVNHNGKVNKYDAYTQNFKLYQAGQAVTALAEGYDNTIWIGTRQGLNRFNPDTGDLTTYQSRPEGLDGNYIVAVGETAPGRLWVSVWFGSFYLMDAETGGIVKRYGPEEGNKAEAYSDIVQDPDDADILWLAGRGPQISFTKFEKESGRFSHFPPNAENPEKGTIGQDVYKIHHDRKEIVIWTASSRGGGLNRFDKRAELFTHYRNNPEDPDSLAHNSIADIYQDRNGALWIGTLGKGLDKYNKENGKFEHFFSDQGVPSNVFGIAEDGKGHLWLSTNKGIVRFNPDAGLVEKHYTMSDGLQGDTFIADSVLKTNAGEIWFGGTNGVNRFHPDRFMINAIPPPMALLSFTQAGEPIKRINPIPVKTDKIVLNWKNNFFEFEYASLNFTAPEKNQYKYMLEGWDQAWYRAGMERKGRYSGLTGGNYTLRIIGSNNDAVWNEEGISLDVTVIPPFWQTLWFRVGTVLLLLFTVAGIAFWRLRAGEIQRRRLEALVDERTKELQAASKAKSDFLSNMSHELRTPLHAILGYTQILKRRQHRHDQKEDCVRIIEDSSEHLLTLINDILDIAKIEAGKVELKPEPIDLASFLDGIVSLMMSRAQSKSLGLAYKNRCDGPLRVVADGTRLRQVLINLLGNAVKFTETGQITLTVDRLDSMGDNTKPKHLNLRFTVSDTGIGISPEIQDRIFLPFEQEDRKAKPVEGTGLGLAISQKIVALMGGEIRLESQPGQGSTFWFDVVFPAAEIETISPLTDAGVPVGYEGPRQRLLVADDAEYNRKLLVELLEPLGFEIISASNGRQAVETALSERPDLILMDMVMPVMSGVDAIKELRMHPVMRETVIISISASVQETDRNSGLDAGADVFLPKPLRQEELYAVLEERLPITWQYETSEPSEIELPADTVTELVDLMRLGQMRKFREYLDDLAAKDAQYKPMIEHLQRLARRYEVKEIMILLEGYARTG